MFIGIFLIAAILWVVVVTWDEDVRLLSSCFFFCPADLSLWFIAWQMLSYLCDLFIF